LFVAFSVAAAYEACVTLEISLGWRGGNLGRRWDDNFKLDPGKRRCEGVDWIYLAQNRVCGSVL